MALSLLNTDEFGGKYTVFVVNYNNQPEPIANSGPVEIRIEYKTDKSIPTNASCYALLFYDVALRCKLRFLDSFRSVSCSLGK